MAGRKCGLKCPKSGQIDPKPLWKTATTTTTATTSRSSSSRLVPVLLLLTTTTTCTTLRDTFI